MKDSADLPDDLDDGDPGLHINLKHLKREAVEDLLVQSIRRQNRLRQMASKRGDDEDDKPLTDDERKAHDENSKLVGLHGEKGEPSDIPATGEDLDDKFANALRDKRSVEDAKAKQSSKVRLAHAKYKAKRNPKAR